ncbi:MAG: UDP-N-acetylglucosamine 1-carboxyvinyltransferase [Bacillota bacterium]|jgi:UDP-N-acetylglucosamine 1-carboxyvinyltransferase
MSIIIRGGRPLEGSVRCYGAKNAALPIMAAALLSDETSEICNVPFLLDVDTMVSMLRATGSNVRYLGGSVHISPGQRLLHEAPHDLVRRMRASFLIMGPLLARCGAASVPLPGGCAIGRRPVDLHLKGFQAMGADITMERGSIRASAKRLQGAEIYLDVPSVGATENIIMAASLAQGETVLENAAEEPEVVDLANFLNAMGADVKGAGTHRIRVTGVRRLKGVKYATIPDRIEAATFAIAAAITRGRVMIENVIPTHLRSVLAKVKELGGHLREGPRWVEVSMSDRPLPTQVKTLPYPGFPTDVQAPFMSLCCIGKGTSIISETVFENRFAHADELNRMGARIRIEGSNAVIEGVERLEGARVQASDLRAGAALCVAGLAAAGVTQIGGTGHIERGYSGLVEKLKGLGADVTRVPDHPGDYLEVAPGWM